MPRKPPAKLTDAIDDADETLGYDMTEQVIRGKANMKPHDTAHSHPGNGRPRGSIGKKRIDARETMRQMKFDPVAELIKRYRDPQFSERTHNLCLVELARRYAPILKSVEVVGLDDNKKKPDGIQINIIAPTMQDGKVVDAETVSNDAITHEQRVHYDLSDVARDEVLHDSDND